MKKLRFSAWWLALAAATFLAGTLSAPAAARLLPFQGRLSDANGAAVPDGARVVQFKIYDAPVGGRAVWNGEVQKLTINSGLVNTSLGTKASLSGVDFNQDLYLEITIDANGDGQISLTDPPLLPRQSILPAVFAYESVNARLLDGYDWSPLFGTNNPADGTLLSSKIGDNAITTARIAAAAVTPSKLDTNGASAGQSLTFNGTNVVWSQVNAVNAQLLNGFDWTAIFPSGNPQSGYMSVASLVSRSDAHTYGSLAVDGTLFAETIGSSMYLNNLSLYLRNNGDNNHFLKYANAYGTTSGFDGPLLVGVGGGVLGAGGSYSLRWYSDGSVNIRGSVGIGTTSPGFTLEVNGTAGKPGGGLWSSSSDARLKKNIHSLAGALDKLLALRGVNFEYIDPARIHELSGERMGLIAQEVEQVFPDWVETGPNGYKRVTVRGLEALVVEALRQLRTENEAKVEELRKQNENFQRRLEGLELLMVEKSAGTR